VAEGKLTVADLKKAKEVKTLGGAVAVSVTKAGDVEVLSVGGAKVSSVSDVEATNGVLHAIEAVITKK